MGGRSEGAPACTTPDAQRVIDSLGCLLLRICAQKQFGSRPGPSLSGLMIGGSYPVHVWSRTDMTCEVLLIAVGKHLGPYGCSNSYWPLRRRCVVVCYDNARSRTHHARCRLRVCTTRV
jgi:hypothetical protein